LKLTISLCLAILLSSLAFADNGILNDLSTKDRIEAFEEVWSTLAEKYYDPSMNGVNWSEVRDRYRPRVDEVKNDQEFYSLLSRMVAELRDAHTRFRSPRQREDRVKQQGISTGITIREIDNQPVVWAVAPESEASRAGVEPGMRIIAVDGKPIAERVKEVHEEIGASSTERATRLLTYARILSGDPDSTLRLGLAGANGFPFEVSLGRRLVKWGPQFSFQSLGSGVAYIRFDEFKSPVSKQVKKALARAKQSPGVVIDFRTNGGGDMREMAKIAGYFFNDRVFLGRATTRTGKPISVLRGLITISLEAYAGRKGEQLYGGPVVILTSERTGSAAELFAQGMQETGRATVIGSQTCGCVLGVLKHREIKGGELDISEFGLLSAKGRKLEGVGVTPDHIILPTISELQNKHDRQLETAETLLKNPPTTPPGR
jgi:carboxyl-terminal processing protease